MRARYVTCEAFTNEFIDAIKDKSMDAFKRRYREEFDVLLIDDIHFLAGKERHPGGVLPHLQHAARERPAARAELAIARRARSPSSPTACARASSGACSSTCSRPTSRRASRSCTSASRPTACASPIPSCCRRSHGASPTNIRELEGALTRVARLRLADRPPGQRRARARDAARPARTPTRRSRSRRSSRSSPRPSASPSPSSSRPSARRTSSPRGRSRCTSAAS